MSGSNVRRNAVVVGVLCGIVGAGTAWGTIAVSTYGTVARTAAPELRWTMNHRGERARCEAEPATWSLEIPDHSRIFAYDAKTFQAANPAAPRLDEKLVRALGRKDVAVHIVPFGGGGAIAVRLASEGPCGITASFWSSRFGRGRLLWLFALSGLLSGFASAAIAVLIGVRPLARRIAIVRRAAVRVGDRQGYVPVERGADDDVGALARELDRAHARIVADTEQIDRQRRDLQRHVADVAHDVRTPMASLQLSVEEAIHARSDADATHAILVRAAEDVVYLGGLTANLPLAAEMVEGWSHAPNATAELGETVDRAAARLRFLAREKRISLDVASPDTPVRVAADPVAAQQAIANLIENAIMHGSPDGHVAVMVELVGDSRFRVTVLDDGPGVAPEDLARLGERTFRTDAARRRDGRGRGLGLAISREICARAGWTLVFAHEEPTGLRVLIEGPRLPA